MFNAPLREGPFRAFIQFLGAVFGASHGRCNVSFEDTVQVEKPYERVNKHIRKQYGLNCEVDARQ
jgi:hypothetical protein